MAKERLFKGGEFILIDASPDDIFTPEDFTEDQRLIGRSAEEFYNGELVPKRDEIEGLDYDLLRSFLKKAGELGFTGADIPEVYEGSELDKVSSTLIMEKISPGITGFSVTYAVQTGIGCLPILLFGTHEQKKKYLPKIAAGEIVAAYALTEPQHGSDALSAETTAVLSDDGKHYILNGQKQFITNAGFADIFLTYGQVDETRFTSFIVEKKWDGVSVDNEEKKMGMHGSSTCAVIFQDVRVPIENVLLEVGRGHIVALNTLNIGRYKLGAVLVGSAKTLITESVKYAKGRVQFGKPICEFGLIKHKISEMVIKTYVNESMVYRTAGLLDLALTEIDLTGEDSGQRIGEVLRTYALECSINKIFGSESFDLLVDEALQIFGGYGYIEDYPIEQAYRDSRINRIWEGTNEINRLVIVDMLMRAARKDELPLLAAIKQVTDELLTFTPDMGEDEEILMKERTMVSNIKKIGLLVAGAAAQKHMEKLANEEEIVALIANIIIEIFAMESALLRTLKKIGKEGAEKSNIHIAATQVYIHDMFPKLEFMAKQIIAAITEGDDLRIQLLAIRRLAKYTPINTIALRREIADSIIPVARYHMTKN